MLAGAITTGAACTRCFARASTRASKAERLECAAMGKKLPPRHIASPFLWPAWIAVAFGWLIARLPLNALLRLGRWIGGLVHAIGGSRKRITAKNVELCFPELTASEQADFVRGVFRHMGVGIVETAAAWLNPHRNLDDRFTVTGLEHLEAAVAEQSGVVLLGGHFAVLDIIAGTLARHASVVPIYRRNKNPVWEWLQLSGRRAHFPEIIERSDTRAILRALKQNKVIWYAADQDYGRKHSVFAPFFGVMAASITGTARFARLRNSPVLLMSHFRDLDSGTYELRFSRPLDDYPSDDDVADATRINALIEAEVRLHPRQYLWVHRRFKTRPEGEARFY